MAFPASYRGEIHWAGASNDKHAFLTLMPIELRAIGLRRVFVQGDRILFGSGTPRYFSNWNILTALDKGEIEVHSSDDQLVVSYHLSFKAFFILISFVCFGLLLVWTIFGHPPLKLVFGSAVLILTLLFLMGLSCRTVTRKLVSVINRLLANIT
jgi:hypothetical protein